MIFNNYLKGYLSSINLYGVSEEKYSDLLFSDPAISLAFTTHKYCNNDMLMGALEELAAYTDEAVQVGHLFGYFSFSPAASLI